MNLQDDAMGGIVLFSSGCTSKSRFGYAPVILNSGAGGSAQIGGGLMPKNKQMPGMTYQVISQNESQAILEYTYLCPYCMRKSTVRSSVYPADYERLEIGGFYDALDCSECGRTADVRFWHTMKID